MKKIFQKVTMAAVVVATAMGVSSCDLGSIKNISKSDVVNFATALTTTRGASNTTYTGTAKLQKDYLNKAGSWEYNPTNGVASVKNYNVAVNIAGTTAIAQIIGSIKKQNTTSQSASLTLGDITVGGVTYSNVQITAVSYDNGNIGDVSNAGYVYSCTYTTGGKTYTTPTDFSSTPYAYVDGTLNSSTNTLSLNVQLVLDDSNQIEVTVSSATSK